MAFSSYISELAFAWRNFSRRIHYLSHRRDSIQSTDYIANYFLNLRVSRTNIENLKRQICGYIIGPY